MRSSTPPAKLESAPFTAKPTPTPRDAISALMPLVSSPRYPTSATTTKIFSTILKTYESVLYKVLSTLPAFSSFFSLLAIFLAILLIIANETINIRIAMIIFIPVFEIHVCTSFQICSQSINICFSFVKDFITS